MNTTLLVRTGRIILWILAIPLILFLATVAGMMPGALAWEYLSNVEDEQYRPVLSVYTTVGSGSANAEPERMTIRSGEHLTRVRHGAGGLGCVDLAMLGEPDGPSLGPLSVELLASRLDPSVADPIARAREIDGYVRRVFESGSQALRDQPWPVASYDVKRSPGWYTTEAEPGLRVSPRLGLVAWFVGFVVLGLAITIALDRLLKRKARRIGESRSV